VEFVQSFVGRGLAFPPRPDRTGAVSLVSGARDVEEAIRIIVGTAPGERPMRPEFGCRIHEHVFDPINPTTMGLIAFAVEQAVLRWEPRVDDVHVEVLRDADDPSVLYVDVDYRIRATNDERNLVFPFYTIPLDEA
jgi:phage baseplate assembly protein W